MIIADYLLAAVYGFFAVRLGRDAWARQQKSLAYGTAAFFLAAVSAILSGTSRALGHTSEPFWNVTAACMGLAVFFLFIAVVYATMRILPRLLMLITGIAQLVLYVNWVTAYHDERYMLYNLASALTSTWILSFWCGRRIPGRNTWWISGAYAAALAAIALQYFGRHDLHNVLQMGAAWLFYKEVAQSEDFRRPVPKAE